MEITNPARTSSSNIPNRDPHGLIGQRSVRLPGERPRVALFYKSGGLLTWREDLQQALLDSGAECRAINMRTVTPAERWEKFRHGKRLFGNEHTCRRLARETAAFAPDLVIVLNIAGYSHMAHEILRAALPAGTPFVGWLCDRREHIEAGVEVLFDGIYYFDTDIPPVLEASGLAHDTRVSYLPLAASPRRYRCDGISLQGRRRRLVFAGNCTPSRQVFFREYRAAGGRIDLYGPHSSLLPTRNRKLSTATLARLYRGSWINLNLFQPENTQRGLNLRTFEIPCAGGLGSYPCIPELAQCFEPDREIVTFGSPAELKRKVDELLADPERVLAMTVAGHRRVLNEHTYHHRATVMIRDWVDASFEPETPAWLERQREAVSTA